MLRIMSSSSRILVELEQRARAAETLIAALKNELSALEKEGNTMSASQVSALKQENEKLKVEVEQWKKKLFDVGAARGIREFSTSAKAQCEAPVKKQPTENKAALNPAEVSDKKETKKVQEKKPKKDTGKSAEPAAAKTEEDEAIDIGRVDLRVGKIVGVKKHPDADSLYVEEVDVGEGKNRTIVSGLVKHVPIEEMQDRVAIFMCNLKPAKMRGITSEGMLMCASTPEKVEILLAPAGAVPGDVVEVEGYARRPDAVMNPKKKIWETVAPDLKTNSAKLATYKGAVLTIPNKGPITSPSLADVQIK